MLLVYRVLSVSQQSSYSSSSSSLFESYSFVRTDVASRPVIFVLILDYKSNPEYKSNDFLCKEGDAKKYIGSAETSFKVRYANPNLSFQNEKYRNSSDLSKHF